MLDCHQSAVEIIIVLEVLVVLVMLRDIIEVLRVSAPCFQRWRAMVSLEHNIGQSRTRDKVCLCLMPAMIILMLCYNLVVINVWQFLIYLSGLYVVRRVLYATVPHHKVGSEFWGASMNAPNLFVITTIVLWLLSVVVMWAFSASGIVYKVVLWVELGYFFVFSIIRQFQILRSQCGALQAFLYLCALEIIPMAGLVVVIFLVK